MKYFCFYVFYEGGETVWLLNVAFVAYYQLHRQ
jgi:hypothetical protein